MRCRSGMGRSYRKASRTIVILGADKKEEDGQTSQAIKIRMRVRLRRYRAEHARKEEGED